MDNIVEIQGQGRRGSFGDRRPTFLRKVANSSQREQTISLFAVYA